MPGMTRSIRPLPPLLLALALAAAGCAQTGARVPPGGLSAEAGDAQAPDCSPGGLRRAGLADGAAGMPDAGAEFRGAAVAEACGFGETGPRRLAALDSFLSGRAEGVALYCSPQNAARMGAAGETPSLSCPAPLRARFADAYAQGAAGRGATAPSALPGARHDPLRRDSWPWGVTPTLGVGIGSGGLTWGLGLGLRL